MKFKDLLYSKNEDVFLCKMESQIQRVSFNSIGRALNQKELEYLKRKANQEIENLIIKIASSGTEK